ncbi:hypothetical protein PC9H_009617 [Pleurotus ostreatus]|uniref:MARVEL domain-containing protein n=1 Tax=Pleurotus ostreatus TaxID=5322 RepID=A0A8H6ZU27_PLEOS|nr:uncharacterized protein PC9H_009617 [Pleurotus ostreatus]KAF7424310.1 hypothetical protein PC9H_009617 [Pleurotus ostreatus]KAJ8692788.1 hypothetical protein PTI98_010066 [Pleurotus ostreatus]
MSFLDRIQGGLNRVLPSKHTGPSTSMSGGIGNGHGIVPFEDDMIVSKPTIVFHASQIFFNFIAMACFASVASFQAKWKVGPSGLSGFAIFVSVAGMFLSAFMLAVPVIYEKHDKFVRLARALKEVRVGFILTGAGNVVSLLIAFITTISAWTQPGCKNPDNDPHADLGDDFKHGLDGWCITKKAGAIFFWLAFVSWLASLVMLILDFRSGKLHRHVPRDPPFHPPPASDVGQHDDEDDEESAYHIPPAQSSQTDEYRRSTLDNSNTASSPFADSNRYSDYSAPNTAYSPNVPVVSRPSMDMYGAFSDPAPSGFGASSQASSSPYSNGPPVLPEPDVGPRVSRTMQYADPYAAIRANISQNPPASNTPPSYESFQGYR